MRTTARRASTIEVLEPRQLLSVTTNDPRLDQLWGLETSQVRDAWELGTGSAAVVVAVVDSGVDYTHPDLYKNIWINPEEIPAAVGGRLSDIDGDGVISFWDLNGPSNQGPDKISDLNANGYIDGADLLRPASTGGWADGSDAGNNGFVDDLIGWDFVNNDNDPMDDYFHGTHVAGTIGALGDNGIGVAGINHKVSIMPVKLLDAKGHSAADAFATARYAIDNGARISNHSYGSLGMAPSAAVQALRELLEYGQARGHLFVGAAGNDANDNDVIPFYPATIEAPNGIAVAASTRQEKLANFSNFGAATVHLAAPGHHVWSTTPMKNEGNGYQAVSGTSMAAPHVAGAAALMLSVNPDLSPAQLRDRILGSVDTLPDLAGKTVTGGRLNVLRAVAAALPAVQSAGMQSQYSAAGYEVQAQAGDDELLSPQRASIYRSLGI